MPKRPRTRGNSAPPQVATDHDSTAAPGRQSQRNLQILLDTVDDLVLVVGFDGRLLHHNRIVEDRLGYGAEELANIGVRRFAGSRPGDDLRTYLPELRAGRMVARRTCLVTREGRRIPTDIKAVAGVWQGRDAVFVIGRDVSEQLAAETELQQLATAVAQAAEAFLIFDVEGVIEYVNPACCAGLRFRREEIVGQNIAILRHDRERPGVYDEIRKALDIGEQWSGRIRWRVEGRDVLIEGTISPLRNASNRITHGVAVFRDVTRLAALEKQLRESQKLEAVGALVGGIAHDFNNILYALQGYAELARDDVSDASPAATSLDEVLRAAARAGNLIKQMLAFGRRSEHGHVRVALRPLVDEVLALIRSDLRSDITVEARVDADCGEVLADPGQIRQVLLNLCDNGIRAMIEGGGQLSIAVKELTITDRESSDRATVRPGGYARLTVSDTGCGMKEEIRTRVFEPYFTTRPQNEGAGMGLAIVHSVVKNHGGTVAVRSREGGGSEFDVLLPVAPSPQPTRPVEESDHSRGSGRRLCVVDDDVAVMDMTAKTLTRFGFEVWASRDPQETLQRFRRDPQQFDAVLTDQTMPRMSGIELAEEMLKLRPDLPIILVTGYGAEASEDRARTAGIHSFVQKPMNMQELATTIDSIIVPAPA